MGTGPINTGNLGGPQSNIHYADTKLNNMRQHYGAAEPIFQTSTNFLFFADKNDNIPGCMPGRGFDLLNLKDQLNFDTDMLETGSFSLKSPATAYNFGVDANSKRASFCLECEAPSERRVYRIVDATYVHWF